MINGRDRSSSLNSDMIDLMTRLLHGWSIGNQFESDRHARGPRFYKKEGGASTARVLALRFIFARTKDGRGSLYGGCSPFLVFMAKVGARSRRPTHRFDDSVF